MKQKKSEASPKFTTKQLAALPLLLDGRTGVEVANALKVQASTVSKWLNHNPAFVQELRIMRQERMRNANIVLDSVTLEAVQELKRLMTSAKSESIRLRACELFLERLPPTKDDTQAQRESASVNLPMLMKALGV